MRYFCQSRIKTFPADFFPLKSSSKTNDLSLIDFDDADPSLAPGDAASDLAGLFGPAQTTATNPSNPGTKPSFGQIFLASVNQNSYGGQQNGPRNPATTPYGTNDIFGARERRAAAAAAAA